MNKKAIGILVGVILTVGLFFGFSKEDDRHFEIVKQLDVFNAVFKELDMFYVDTIDPKTVIEYGINAMLMQTDPYSSYYPKRKPMTIDKHHSS